MTVSIERLTAEADESHSGLRLDRFLSGRFPELSRTRLQALIKQGRVVLGAATIEDVKYPVKPGDRFELTVPPPISAKPEAQAMPLNILYEDDATLLDQSLQPGAAELREAAAQEAIKPEPGVAFIGFCRQALDRNRHEDLENVCGQRDQ